MFSGGGGQRRSVYMGEAESYSLRFEKHRVEIYKPRGEF